MNIMSVPLTKPSNSNSISQSKAANSLGGFGDILSQNLTSLQGNSPVSESTMKEEISKLAELLDFLKLNSITDIEQGEQAVNGMLLNSIDLQNHPLLEEILGKQGLQSIEELISKLMKDLNLPADDEDMQQNILNQLQMIVESISESIKNSLSNSPTLAGQSSTAETVLKFAKLFTLMKNNIDLSMNQVEKLDALKQSLDKLVSKLETLINTTMNEKSAYRSLLLSKSNQYQLQAINTQSVKDLNLGTAALKPTSSLASSENGFTNNPFLSMTKVEQFVLTMPESKPTSNSEQFIKAFENILSRSQLTNINGIQKLLIKLNPENLGSLRIELIQREGIMMARIIASSSGAKELLDSQLNGLKQAFANQNISVEKLEISQSFTNLSQERNLQREQENQQRQQQQEQLFVDDEEAEAETFLNQFEEAKIQAGK